MTDLLRDYGLQELSTEGTLGFCLEFLSLLFTEATLQRAGLAILKPSWVANMPASNKLAQSLARKRNEARESLVIGN